MVAFYYEGGMQLDSGRSFWGWVESGDHLWYYDEKGSTNFAPLKKLSLEIRQWLIGHNVQFVYDKKPQSNIRWAKQQFKKASK
jgi:hypothetical protein